MRGLRTTPGFPCGCSGEVGERSYGDGADAGPRGVYVVDRGDFAGALQAVGVWAGGAAVRGAAAVGLSAGVDERGGGQAGGGAAGGDRRGDAGFPALRGGGWTVEGLQQEPVHLRDAEGAGGDAA